MKFVSLEYVKKTIFDLILYTYANYIFLTIRKQSLHFVDVYTVKNCSVIKTKDLPYIVVKVNFHYNISYNCCFLNYRFFSFQFFNEKTRGIYNIYILNNKIPRLCPITFRNIVHVRWQPYVRVCIQNTNYIIYNETSRSLLLLYTSLEEKQKLSIRFIKHII